MKKFILSISALALMLGLATYTHADNNNDPDANKYKIASIKWINANTNKDQKDIDDKYVVLIGKATERIDEDTYKFDDGTGTVILDVKDGIELPVNKRIVVRGEIDEAYWDMGKLEINVKTWRKENKTD